MEGGGGSGLSVAGCLEGGKGTCGYGYMLKSIGWVYPHILMKNIHIGFLDPDALLFL